MKVFLFKLQQYALKPREKQIDKEKGKKNYEELITKLFKSSISKEINEKNKPKSNNYICENNSQISPSSNNSQCKLQVSLVFINKVQY